MTDQPDKTDVVEHDYLAEVEHIQFDGRECVVLAPEDYESLRQRLEKVKRENAELRKIANTALGTATGMMCALGADWPTEAAPLCNTSGDLGQWAKDWERVQHKAHGNLLSLNRERDELRADVDRLNQMLRETGQGQGAIDAYVAQCEELDELRNQISEGCMILSLLTHESSTGTNLKRLIEIAGDQNERVIMRERRVVAERDELRAIIERLPKTADGVPVVPGMKVWRLFNDTFGARQIDVDDISVDQLCCSINDGGESDGWNDVVEADYCYSTREAAAAARAEGTQ